MDGTTPTFDDVVKALTLFLELSRAATPGPWYVYEAKVPGYVSHYGVSSYPAAAWPNVVYATTDHEGYGNGSRAEDAQLIVLSRDLAPGLAELMLRLIKNHEPISGYCATCDVLSPCPELDLIIRAVTSE